MPRLIGAAIGAVTALNRLVFRVTSLLMLVIVPVMLYAVTARYLFNAPSSWGLELATLLFGPFFLLGGPYLLHTGGHVNLDLVRRAVSPRMNRIFDLLNYPVIAAYAVILFYFAWPFAMQSYALGETSYTSWNPVIWPVKFIIPIALALLLLQALAEWLRVLFQGEPTGADEDAEATGDGL